MFFLFVCFCVVLMGVCVCRILRKAVILIQFGKDFNITKCGKAEVL